MIGGRRSMYDRYGVLADNHDSRSQYDYHGFLAHDYSGRCLYTSSGNKIMDYERGSLYDNSGYTSLHFIYRTLQDSLGRNSHDYGGRVLYSHDQQSIDYENRFMNDRNGTSILYYDTSLALAANGQAWSFNGANPTTTTTGWSPATFYTATQGLGNISTVSLTTVANVLNTLLMEMKRKGIIAQ